MRQWILAGLAASLLLCACGEKTPVYKDARHTAGERADDLLKRMSVEEKLGQLLCPLGWPMYEKVDGDVRITDAYRKFIKEQHGGMLWGAFRAEPWTRKTLENGLTPALAVKAFNAFQRYAIDSTRLGIPILLAEEAPHGHMAIGTTVFPTSIGLSATWNTELLGGVLRDRWHFDGFVVSDLESIDGLYTSHHVARDRQEAGEMALKAGVDVDLGAHCFSLLKESVEAGRVPMAVLDRAVKRVLVRKFEAGLFDHPYLPEDSAAEVRSPEHVAVAAQVARESVTLLKNNGVLPLRAGTRIALVGPNADKLYNQLGDYTAPQDPENIVTMRKGLENAGACVTYVKGCAVRDVKSDKIADAVQAARRVQEIGHFPGCEAPKPRQVQEIGHFPGCNE